MGLSNKDYSILGSILGSPYFGEITKFWFRIGCREIRFRALAGILRFAFYG